MHDVLITSIVMMLGFVVLYVVSLRASRSERFIFLLSFVARLISAIAMVLLTRYFFGGGDLLTYHQQGMIHVDFLLEDFFAYAPDTIRYTLGYHFDDTHYWLSGTSTGSMIGVSAWLLLMVGGRSLYAVCMLVGLGGFVSQWLIYRVCQQELPKRYHTPAAFSIMLIPSFVFWTSALLKESIAVLGMGPVIFGLSMIARKRWSFGHLFIVVAGSLLISLVKAYLLFAIFIASGVWLYWWRTARTSPTRTLTFKPFSLAMTTVMLVGGVWALGLFFPRYSLSNLSEEVTHLQQVGATVQGSSNYTLSSANSGQTQSLLFAPLGLFFSLFRPLPFEVHNAAVLLNSLEMLFIVVLWARLWRVRALHRTFSMLVQSPFLMFCVVFVLIMGTLVGISTTNMGTLSRYRVPMMPFYVMVLVVLGTRLNTKNP